VSGPRPSAGATGFTRLLIRGKRGPFRWTAYVLAVTSFTAAIPTPLYPGYEHQFQFGTATLALLFAAYSPGVLLTLFVVAPRAEQFGRKRLLYLGMGLTLLAAVVFASAQGFLWLAAGRALSGLAVGATTSVATAAMTDLEPYRDQHHVARVAVAANFGAFAVGVVLSGLMVQFAPDPTQLVYLLPAAASVLGLLAVSVTPETATALGTAATVAVQRLAVPTEVRRPFWVAVGAIAACYSIYGLFAALGPSVVRTTYGIASPLAGAGIVALMFGLAAATQLATAQVRDRRALLLGTPVMVVALVALVIVLPLNMISLLALVSALLGVSVGLTFMGSVTLIDRVCPEDRRGEMLAAFYSAGYLALAVPTIGVAVASEVVGLTSAGILFASALAAAVALLYIGIYRVPLPPGGGGRVRARRARDAVRVP
jgi:MFS family permease